MAVSFNKEVITEAIQEVLAETVSQMYVTPTNKKDIKDALKKKGVTDTSAVDKAKPGEVIAVEEDHHENPNDDSDMAKSQLYAIAKYALELLQMIKDGDPLDAWVQAKITKASDYIDAVQHYLEGEEYLDANQGESEEELAEGDYQARTKEDLVFQYLRDAWQFGALKGKDVNPDEELSIMADSLLANLPDYDASNVDEGIGNLLKKGIKGAVTNVPLPKESLLKVVDIKIEKLLQDGGNVIKIAQLKGFLEDKIEDGTITTIKPINAMIAKVETPSDEKSAFEKRLDKMRAQQNLKEDTLDEIKKAEFEKIKPGKELQLRGYGVVTVVANDGIVMKIKDSLDKVHTINLGQYNEKFLKEEDDVEPSKKDLKAAEKETGGKKTHFTPEAQNMHNVIKNKVTKIEKKIEARDDYKLDLAALKQYISKPEVRKALGAKHIKCMVSSIISETITEGVSCCGRCGRVHESAQDCKKPYISKDSLRHCKNKK